MGGRLLQPWVFSNFWGLQGKSFLGAGRQAGKDLFCRFGVARNLNLKAGISGVYGNEELV